MTMIGLSAATAGATPVSFSDTVTPNVELGCIFGICSSPYSYTQDITDAASGSFNSATDTLNLASLTLNFDDVSGVGTVRANLSVDGSTFWNNAAVADVSFGSASFPALVTALTTDGKITVTITPSPNLADRFTLVSSTLTASGDRAAPQDPLPTPEPGTIMLLATGLAGLTVRGRHLLKRH
jgi:hypothetical protein